MHAPRLKRALVWSLLSLFSLASCEGKTVTQIIVSVATDMQIPTELDQVGLTVTYSGRPQPAFDNTWELRRNAPRFITLPARFALLPGNNPNQVVDITVRGLLNNKTAITRRASLTFARGRILLLRMNLLKQCVPVKCSPEKTCGEAGCESVKVIPANLPGYSPRIEKNGQDAGVFDSFFFEDLEHKSDSSPQLDSGVDLNGDAGGDLNGDAGGDLNGDAGGDLNGDAGGDLNGDAGGDLNVDAGGDSGGDLSGDTLLPDATIISPPDGGPEAAGDLDGPPADTVSPDMDMDMPGMSIPDTVSPDMDMDMPGMPILDTVSPDTGWPDTGWPDTVPPDRSIIDAPVEQGPWDGPPESSNLWGSASPLPAGKRWSSFSLWAQQRCRS